MSSSSRSELFLPPFDTLVLSDFPNLSELVVPDDFLSNDIENIAHDTTMLHDLDPKVDLKTLPMPEINDFCIALETSIQQAVAEEDRGGVCHSAGDDIRFDGFKLDSIPDFASTKEGTILRVTHEYSDDDGSPLMEDIIMSSATTVRQQQQQEQEQEEAEEDTIGYSSAARIMATKTTHGDDDQVSSLSVDEERGQSSSSSPIQDSQTPSMGHHARSITTTTATTSSSSSCLVLPPNIEPTNIPSSSVFHIDSPVSSPTLAAASSSAAFGGTKHNSSLHTLHNLLCHDVDNNIPANMNLIAMSVSPQQSAADMITDSVSSNVTFSSSSSSSVPSPRGDASQILRIDRITNEAQQDHPGSSSSTMIRSQSSHSLGQLRSSSSSGNLMSPCPENSTFSHPLELQIPATFSSLHGQFPYYQASSPVFVEGTPVRRVFSTGDLQALNSMHICCYGNTNAGHMEHPNNEEALGWKIGHYTVEERKERLHRYRQKRNERNFSKKIKYACRKTLADSRPRVRGRFARTLDDSGETLARENGDDDHHKETYGSRMNLSGKCSMVKEPGAPHWKPLRMNFAMGHGV